jgi:hypothetical protein
MTLPVILVLLYVRLFSGCIGVALPFYFEDRGSGDIGRLIE